MKRNIKRENEIIKSVVENVKQFYLWKLNNYTNYDDFMKNVYHKILEDCYYYFDEDNQKDRVMGEFATYMVNTFSNGGRPWFDTKDKNRIYAVENKLLKAIQKADLKKYAFEHIDEIKNKVIKMHIKGLFE